MLPFDGLTTFLVHGEENLKVIFIHLNFVRSLLKSLHARVLFALPLQFTLPAMSIALSSSC